VSHIGFDIIPCGYFRATRESIGLERAPYCAPRLIYVDHADLFDGTYDLMCDPSVPLSVIRLIYAAYQLHAVQPYGCC
jgi:hypothetical protein